jgi:YD repeat-containing protein
METYGSNLHITNLRDASNNQLTFAYDTGAKLTTVTDGNNNSVSYSYYPDGRIMTVSAPSNRSVTFHYDSDSNLTSVDMINAGNTKTINYTYSPPNSDQNLTHNLISFTDAK